MTRRARLVRAEVVEMPKRNLSTDDKRLRQAVVASVAADGTVGLTVNGATRTGYPVVASYVPVVGDAVEVLRDGPDWLVLGRTGFAASPRGALDVQTVVANQSAITAETLLNGLSTSFTVPAGRLVRVAVSYRLVATVAGDVARLRIKSGASELRVADTPMMRAGTGTTLYTDRILTPLAGSHAYDLTLQRSAGTGSLTLEASANNPVHVVVEDIGVP